MNELKIINQQEVLGKDFKVYGDFENPLFLAKDVAEWIGHSDVSTMVKNVDEDEKVTNIVCTLGGNQECLFLTENGLYEVLMQSRKPIAKEFKKQVKTILKDIRKTGMYATDELLDNPDLLIQLATQLKAERAEKKTLETKVAVKDQQIAELQPKATYYDRILNNKGLAAITQIAKDYGMSGKKLNSYLNVLKVQYKQGGQWLLYSKYQDKGYTHSKTIDITRSDGRKDVVMETKWTQSGRLFLYDLLKREGILPLIEK